MKKLAFIAATVLLIQGCVVTGERHPVERQSLTDKQFADRISATCAGYGKAAQDSGGNFVEVFDGCMNNAVAILEKNVHVQENL
jgi:PBP1b-binding outer membrane lipoprotein LpoB